VQQRTVPHTISTHNSTSVCSAGRYTGVPPNLWVKGLEPLNCES
jgi:hypothetical protein